MSSLRPDPDELVRRALRADPSPREGAAQSAAAAERAAGRIAARAREEGLAEVLYAPVDSPFGTMLAASTERGLVRLAFPEEDIDAVLERLAMRLSPRILLSPTALDGVRR